jgi:hypothetical protein
MAAATMAAANVTLAATTGSFNGPEEGGPSPLRSRSRSARVAV